MSTAKFSSLDEHFALAFNKSHLAQTLHIFVHWNLQVQAQQIRLSPFNRATLVVHPLHVLLTWQQSQESPLNPPFFYCLSWPSPWSTSVPIMCSWTCCQLSKLNVSRLGGFVGGKMAGMLVWLYSSLVQCTTEKVKGGLIKETNMAQSAAGAKFWMPRRSQIKMAAALMPNLLFPQLHR